MRTVLVVEDEKLIRQGISTMIKRCGVPVEEVIECANGLKAMEVLREKDVDVMFTDIRMPKMNGIELVNAMQELERKPITIAVSGYDDFSYAVEMMRGGVREYILKPVERDKLKSVMEKLEEEISKMKDVQKNNRELGKKFLKYVLEDQDESPETLEALGKNIREEVGDSYYIVVSSSTDEIQKELSDSFMLSETCGTNVYIVGKEKYDLLIEKLSDEENGIVSTAGISDCYTDAVDLKKAYLQAIDRRSRAFFSETIVYETKGKSSVPEKLIENGIRLCDKAQVSTRVHLIGTDKTEQLEKEWNGFFIAAGREQIPAKEFEAALAFFTKEFENVYKKSFPMDASKPYLYGSLSEFRDAFLDAVYKENSRFMENTGDTQTEKMIQAVDYIKKNFQTDINMAVVSNYVSMNYSLFSTAFKNYTGQNFVSYVRDLRISEAKKLLLESQLRVNDIGEKVGYDNSKHFMKNFKAVVGVSPTEFRRNSAHQ